jgi:CheY-like chemotaxis protein
MAAEKTILLVDDNVVQAAIRQTILKRAGYFVVTALDPRRALEMLGEDNLPTEVELVITDHVMPGMSGTKFVSELRTRFPKLPVLVVTGMQEAGEQYLGLDVTFRVKPLPPEQLLDCVRGLIVAPQVASAGTVGEVVQAAR